MKTLISIVSDKNLNIIQAIRHFSAEKVILLQTKESIQFNWKKGINRSLSKLNISEVIEIELTSNSDDSINQFYPILKDLVHQENQMGNRVYLNIGTGLRQHSLLFWRAFLANPQREIFFISPNQKKFEMEIWEIINGEIVFSTEPINHSLGFEDVLLLNGYKISNPNSKIFDDGKIIEKNYFALINFLGNIQEMGRLFEKAVYQELFTIIHDSLISCKIKEIHLGTKVALFEQNDSECEYDLIIYDQKQRIYIFEFKSSPKVVKREFESQMALADKWGGRFIHFYAVRRFIGPENLRAAEKLAKFNIGTIYFDESGLNKFPAAFSLKSTLKSIFST